jgi:DNA-binding CsgD family transcriptional regulator
VPNQIAGRGYGEWLRRKNRRVDARRELRIAHEMFTSIGMEAFAERARRELLARDGMSNIDIAARLFLSQHTVAYHLRKVFSKLRISSRRELATALPSSRRR